MTFMNRMNYPKEKFSFEAPAGFRRVAAPGYLWCGLTAAGERITVQLWKRNTGLTELKPQSSAQVYAHFHPKLPGKTFLRGSVEGMQVSGAPASFSGIERLQYGKPVRSYQMLALFAGNLYVFEYTAPMPRAEKGVVAFSQLLESVRWTGMVPPTPKKPDTLLSLPNPAGAAKPESTLAEKLGLPGIPATRAVSTKAGGVLNSGL